ncbi:protein PHLOEM PROTEIN 2-LIKE A1-like [Tripterygium wilfordii]|uniref:protein PHLOEM PROTEIN 2-LIKE A1-like n=1 Tax=Tripterygium wilfordii TaxID=458696 RepID=UPI0018F85FC4|nr:protein PHLOEM PROTEIN 2-LIKE A1-like [Tripterygium wilfordii]
MGADFSKDLDLASQSQPSQDPTHTESQKNETRVKAVEIATEQELGETKAKAGEKTAEVKPNETKANVVANKIEAKASTNKAKATAEAKLPYNYEAIIRDADSPIDRSSTDKLYEQLCNGVFLNQKRKKYWVERKSNSNCFMLFARDLLITWAEEKHFWQWSYQKDSSDVFMDVAELLNVCWLEVHGRLDATKLSPGTLYEVAFVIMLKDPAYGWETPVNFRLILPNGMKKEHKENLMTKPRGQWLEIPVAEFRTSPESTGEMEISMYEYEGGVWKKGLVVKGALIRPKN